MSLVALFISIAILAVLIILVNLTFMLMVYHKGSLKKIENALVFSLACSDLCIGFFAIPIILLCNIMYTSSHKCPLCVTSYLLHRFYFFSTVMHLLAVVCERFTKILYPFWYENAYRRLRSKHIIPALWFSSLVISAIPLTWLLDDCDSEKNTKYTNYYDYAFMTLVSVFLLFMIQAFVRIYLVVRAHLSNIRAVTVPLNGSLAPGPSHQCVTDDLDYKTEEILQSRQHSTVAGSDTQSDHDGLAISCQKSRRYWLNKEARIIIRFATMVFVYILGWGAYVVISAQEQVGNEVSSVVQEIFTITRFLNPLINPLIMTINNREFRGTWDVFKRCFYWVVALCLRTQPTSNSAHDEIRETRETYV